MQRECDETGEEQQGRRGIEERECGRVSRHDDERLPGVDGIAVDQVVSCQQVDSEIREPNVLDVDHVGQETGCADENDEEEARRGPETALHRHPESGCRQDGQHQAEDRVTGDGDAL